VPVSMDTLPDGAPHNCVAVSISGGLGRTLEGILDRVTFSVLIRGANGATAEAIGEEFDRLWMETPSGHDIGDARVIDKGRFSGPPAFVGVDGNEKYPGRVIRSATYYCEIEY
jgi:hypothetical protein